MKLKILYKKLFFFFFQFLLLISFKFRKNNKILIISLKIKNDIFIKL